MSDEELAQSKHQYQNLDHSKNEFENKKDNPEKRIDQVIQEIEMQEKGGSNGTESNFKKFNTDKIHLISQKIPNQII